MNVNTQEVITTVKKRWHWVAATTAAFTLFAFAYALLKQDRFDARQPLLVRDEGYGSIDRLGDFASVDAMQTAQETILEVAKHPLVLKAALTEAGPPKKLSKRAAKNWPTPKTVEQFAADVSVAAPGGAQFGRTEIIYLTVKAESSDRAVTLVDLICKHLVEQMQILRQEKYTSIIDELATTTNLARRELTVTTEKVKRFEASLGSDLAELRMSMDNAQGQSHLRRALTDIDADLRKATSELTQIRNEIQQLSDAEMTPALLITMPNQALDSQPTLKRLKESYVDAQVLASKLASELNAEHPRLKAAMDSEAKLKQQAVTELRAAIQSREVALKNAEGRVAALHKQREQVDNELAALSTLRTEYANLLAELDQRNSFLKRSEQDLGNARANMLSSAGISLIQRVKSPIGSVDPLGPGKTVIVLAGMFAGALSGLAFVYVFGLEVLQKRRLADQISYGRRNDDAARTKDGKFINRRAARPGRRASDRSGHQTAAAASKPETDPQTSAGSASRQTNPVSLPPLELNPGPNDPISR